MIGGNIRASILEIGSTKSTIGESVTALKRQSTSLVGYLDYTTGTANYNTYNSKFTDASHVFICDYIPFKFDIRKHLLQIDGELYDITLVDDPMRLHQHLEIYLKSNEAYNGCNIYE